MKTKNNKKNIIIKNLTVILILGWGFSNTSLAASKDYLMWQIPSSGISLPVYIYQNNKQIDYIPSISLQYFAGEYNPTSTSAKYNLYYKKGKSWFGCELVLKKGIVDSSSTCSGAVINPPTTQNGATSNVYTVGFGASAWPAASKPSPKPVSNRYDNRTITFTNNTDYPMIQIGESCNPSNASNSAPSCQNSAIIATIKKGKSHIVTVGTNGLNSSAFYLSSYCNLKTLAKCGKAPTIADCSFANPKPPTGWVCTGGYFPGQTPYATKIEPTILAVSNGVPDGASNVDVSAVDGFSLGVKFYPAEDEYCTYTVPPENSNVLGAGYYNIKAPLAQIAPQKSNSLKVQCSNSSQLPAGNSTDTKWDLAKLSKTGDFEGCMSPCTYATANVGKNGITQDDADRFCCKGNYNTPSSCNVAKGVIGANTSTYNENIQTSDHFQNVYGFAYGDAGSDYACPPETDFVVEFISI
jgi:hypothetical protein